MLSEVPQENLWEHAVCPDARSLMSPRLCSCPQVQARPLPVRRRAVVLLGQHLVSDTEVQLYQRVLQQMDFEVLLSRSTETSSLLRSNHGNTSWCGPDHICPRSMVQMGVGPTALATPHHVFCAD